MPYVCAPAPPVAGLGRGHGRGRGRGHGVVWQAGRQAASEWTGQERFCHSSFHQYGSYSFD
jgi:hypothetical protein